MSSKAGSSSYMAPTFALGFGPSLTSIPVSPSLTTIPTASKGSRVVYKWFIWLSMTLSFAPSHTWNVLNTTDVLLFNRKCILFS